MMNYMFGVPFYKSKVDENRYEKTKIIEEINYNYSVDPDRNAWDNTSKLHHSYNDNENPNFKKISYDSLVPLYKEHVVNYLNAYFDCSVQYNFYITNYTCFSKGQYMRVHNHPRSCFSGVHYLQFNRSSHEPTLYYNSSDWAFYTESFFPEIMRNKHSRNLKHSWMQENFTLDIEEDDIVITPSTLRHSVPISHSDELRMVIVFHLDIIED